jgi:membrane protein YdbS with pleckstrin-like domain
MTEPDLRQTRSDRSSRQWVKLAITLVLLVAVIAAGTAAFHSRNLWWEKYLSYIR